MIYRCVLFDVGGTLWPDRWPQPSGDSSCESSESRVARLRRVLPALAPTLCEALLEHLHLSWTRNPPADPLLQDTDQRIADALRHVAAGASVDAPLVCALRRAMCVPALGHIGLFPGARELLLSVKGLGLSCVLVTNSVWRDAQCYRRDFAELGVPEGVVDTIVTSADVGVKKPHPAMFGACLSAARCSAAECVMIGNSEDNDVLPAVALGMRTIRVAIEGAKPATSAACAIATSLPQVDSLLRTWA